MNPELKERISQQIASSQVVLFMKGSPSMPMCGFSASAVQILRAAGVQEIWHVDVLRDPEIREGIKEYSSWPTIPQLYINQQFVGGSDIVRELYERGELSELLSAKPAAESEG